MGDIAAYSFKLDKAAYYLKIRIWNNLVFFAKEVFLISVFGYLGPVAQS